VIIPFWLSTEIGLSNIINPIKTINGRLYHKISFLYVILFPYINGQSGWDISFTKDQFNEFGQFMHRLHSVKLPNEHIHLLPAETYSQKCGKMVKKYLKDMKNKMYDNSVIIDFFYILKNNENTIIRMIGFLENMIQRNIGKNKGLCLCHGDIHAGNIFIEENKFYVVDWDTIIMAPKEKDLMFIGGGIGSKWNKDEEIEYFYKGYGKELGIDKDLIKYYRYERIIQDIYEFYQQIIDIETTEEKRKECLKSFKETFEPNNVVDIASRT
jgi:spectinomycin phosphotransferase